MRILIAEDDLTSRTMLAAVLRKSGHDVIEAGNGAEAWEILQQPQAPKLVIVDWMMPMVDGLELLRLVRSLPTDHPPYLIMLTAKGEKTDIITGLDAGANDYLGKPFDPGELRARVEVGCRMVEMQTALIASREALVYQATRDPLTGMRNRRAILDHLGKELAHVHRHGDVLAVGMCDIDHFKQVNDTYGHQTGDEILCGLTQIFRQSLRQHDTVGRMGGEEFLVVSTMQAGGDCLRLFDRVRRLVADNRISTRSGDLAITLSIGVAMADSGATVDTLLETSDLALYRAKDAGRNRVVLARDLDDQPNHPHREDRP